MCCAEKHARIIAIEKGQESTVHTCNGEVLLLRKVKTIHVQYTHNIDCGKTFILQVNHYLDFTNSMEQSIVCTNQSRSHRITINDCPTIFNKYFTQ